MDHLLAVTCKEGNTYVTRKVKQLLPDPVEALRIHDSMKSCPAMLGKTAATIEQLLRDWWKFYTVDDVGLLAFDPYQPGKAHVHVTFWDRRLRGRELLCAATALHLMREMNVQLVVTAIPLDFRAVRAFAKRVGFQHMKDVDGREVLIADADCFTMKHPGVE